MWETTPVPKAVCQKTLRKLTRREPNLEALKVVVRKIRGSTVEKGKKKPSGVTKNQNVTQVEKAIFGNWRPA